MTTLELFTDGARKGDKAGGWGCILRYGNVVKEIYGGELDTTNNRMEMMAVIEGLATLKRGCAEVLITTDSQYVLKGATEWMAGWKRRKWLTQEGEPVKNKDLWLELDALLKEHTKVTWKWVKGHKGHVENERADALANKGVEWARKQALL
jgi:ribonuclease HI